MLSKRSTERRVGFKTEERKRGREREKGNGKGNDESPIRSWEGLVATMRREKGLFVCCGQGKMIVPW